MMKKTILLTALAGFIFTSCDKKTETTESVESTTVESTENSATEKTTEKEWAGTYQGVLPCADCEGIDTEIMLHDDNTYMMKYLYLAKEDKDNYSEEGTVVWNEDNTQFTLTPSKADEKPSLYKLKEGSIVMLNEDGSEVTGDLADAYILKKK